MLQSTSCANLLKAVRRIQSSSAWCRFKYSHSFLKWALQPPGFKPEWHLGVRVASNRKLVGFITAVPASIRARQNTVAMVEINFLCVHKKLRSKRLAPVLIKVGPGVCVQGCACLLHALQRLLSTQAPVAYGNAVAAV